MITGKCILLKKTQGWTDWTQCFVTVPRQGEFIRKEGKNKTYQILRVVHTTVKSEPILELHLYDL